MSQINSNTKDDFQVVFLLSCFVGHPVLKYTRLSGRLRKSAISGLNKIFRIFFCLNWCNFKNNKRWLFSGETFNFYQCTLPCSHVGRKWPHLQIWCWWWMMIQPPVNKVDVNYTLFCYIQIWFRLVLTFYWKQTNRQTDNQYNYIMTAHLYSRNLNFFTFCHFLSNFHSFRSKL